VRGRAVLLLVPLLSVATACGESTVHNQEYLYMQKCAACHGVGPGALPPNPKAKNLFDENLTREQVRRAIIDGRKGMPKGLLGGSDVDRIADYLAKGSG
jgi:mono/diheme cytochrome c family protein